MMNSLKLHLAQRLEEDLPWEVAFSEAAPFRKLHFSASELKVAKISAVLILFYLKRNEIHVALIQRPTYEGTHSGQISFPGGKQEKNDVDIVDTALREAHEEVGIVKADVEVMGQLTEVYIPVSKFKVTPVLGWLDYYPQFVLDEREVEALIEVKLSDLTAMENLEITPIKLANNTILKAPSFIFNTHVVWGATALMLNELRHILMDWERSP